MISTHCLDTISTGKKFDSFRECTIAGYEFIAEQNKIFPIDQFDKVKPSFSFDCVETPEQSI